MNKEQDWKVYGHIKLSYTTTKRLAIFITFVQQIPRRNVWDLQLDGLPCEAFLHHGDGSGYQVKTWRHEDPASRLVVKFR